MIKTSLIFAKLFSTITALIVGSAVVLSGCQATKEIFGKRDNGSLDYQSSKKLAPLQLPVNQEPAPFVPLYPTPNIGINTLSLKNDSGKQYQLPMPERTLPVTSTGSK